jgi:predicted RNA-binding protein with PUA-like domain
MKVKYFLAKSEPNAYSIDDLYNDGVTWWDGVHNYSAILTIKSWKIGDKVFFYRSVENPAIVGLMEVVSDPVFDTLDERKISWKAQVRYIQKYQIPVTLKEIKSIDKFSSFTLVTNSRLSVMACTEEFVSYVTTHN